MKRITLAALGSLALMSSASAADLRGLKDADAPGISVVEWRGLYVGVHGGYGWGTWEGTRSVGRSASEYRNSTCVTSAKTAATETSTETTYGGTEADCTAIEGEYTPYADKLLGSEAFKSAHQIDMDGWFGGVDVSYKMRFNNVIVEPFIDASFGGGKGSASWTRNIASYTDPDGVKQDLSDWGVTESGAFTVEKQWGATVGLKGGLLVTPRDEIYILGGLSYGNFKVHGGSSISSDIVPTYAALAPGMAYSSDESAWGWTVGGGYERAITDRLHLGFEGRYTKFEDIGAHTTASTPLEAYGYKVDGKDGVNGDYDEWSLRARLTYKLSD